MKQEVSRLGRETASQAVGSGFESRLPLTKSSMKLTKSTELFRPNTNTAHGLEAVLRLPSLPLQVFVAGILILNPQLRRNTDNNIGCLLLPLFFVDQTALWFFHFLAKAVRQCHPVVFCLCIIK